MALHQASPPSRKELGLTHCFDRDLFTLLESFRADYTGMEAFFCSPQCQSQLLGVNLTAANRSSLLSEKLFTILTLG
ncbi:MAG TPA: hypothetical protein V6D09_02490 [Leptolyngbyaceae cyanobacterium]